MRGVGEGGRVHQMENFKPNAINITPGGKKKGIESGDGIKGMWWETQWDV